MQDKLDRLFDKGYVSKSELDDYTLDSLKGGFQMLGDRVQAKNASGLTDVLIERQSLQKKQILELEEGEDMSDLRIFLNAIQGCW